MIDSGIEFLLYVEHVCIILNSVLCILHVEKTKQKSKQNKKEREKNSLKRKVMSKKKKRKKKTLKI